MREQPADRRIIGDGPELARLRAAAGPNVVDEAKLTWLYKNACGLVSASYADFGLTRVEAAAFGKPTAALRFGCFLDTVREGETGVFFDTPDPGEVAKAVASLRTIRWDADALRGHAGSFSEEQFIRRMRAIVDEELETRA